MNNEDILIEINKVFMKVFRKKAVKVFENTSAKDVPGWDSLHNILIVNAIEAHFKLKFTTLEIIGWKSVGDICGSIARRLLV